MKKVLFGILFAIILQSTIIGEDSKKPEEIKNKEAVDIYEKYALKPYTDFWTGYGYTRNYDSKKFKANAFGMDKELMKILMESPSSRVVMAGYQKEMLAAKILYWGGLGAMVADIFYVLLSPTQGTTMTDQVVYWSLLGGGFTSSILGALIMVSAYQKAQEAIWLYNKDLISGTTKVTQINEPHVNLAFHTSF